MGNQAGQGAGVGGSIGSGVGGVVGSAFGPVGSVVGTVAGGAIGAGIGGAIGAGQQMPNVTVMGATPGSNVQVGSGVSPWTQEYYKKGLQLGGNFGNQGTNYNQMGMRGPNYAYEDQGLAQNEANAAGYDQAGGLQLSREAAMGQAPSAAAYTLQHGLDSAEAQQRAVAGSARGGNAIALAQGNQGANIANLQQQAFANASAMRAQEMAQARGDYNQAAQVNRSQDLTRIGQANDMSQGNAGLGANYQLGMGGLANNMYNLQAQQYVNNMAPIQMDTSQQNKNYDTYAQGQENYDNRFAGGQGMGYQRDSDNTNRLAGLGGTAMTAAGGVISAGINGPKKA